MRISDALQSTTIEDDIPGHANPKAGCFTTVPLEMPPRRHLLPTRIAPRANDTKRCEDSGDALPSSDGSDRGTCSS
jgi:hypothetical protein